MNFSKLNLFSLLIAVVTMTVACNNDDDTTAITTETSTLNLNLEGLEDVGSDYAYEGWLIVDGAPVTTGVFNVDANGTPSRTAFDLDTETIENATAFVLTIEPAPDNDPAPSAVHILAGDISNGTATLNVEHDAALGTNFLNSTGQYILATPTNDNDNDELSGVWWLNPMAGPGAGLDLPELPEGWIYEGWAVVNGTPLSTGTFRTVTGSDNAAPFSGDLMSPPFPGEDFLKNAPAGLDFPVDLSEGTIVISVEPVPDNSAAPFLLKPLVSPVPANAIDHSVYDMSNNAGATNPTGSVSITQ